MLACAALVLPTRVTEPFEYYRIDFGAYRLPDWERCLQSRLYKYHVLAYLRDHTPPDSIVFTQQQRDIAFYLRRPFIRDIDPRMIPFARQTDTRAAYEQLRRLGIEFIFLPYFHEPVFYRTELQRIVADPALSRIVAEHGEYRLYALRNPPATAKLGARIRDDRSFEPLGVDPTRLRGGPSRPTGTR